MITAKIDKIVKKMEALNDELLEALDDELFQLEDQVKSEFGEDEVLTIS
jgi:hypothetical protein